MAAAGAPIKVPVAVACGVLKLSRQGYYQWLAEPFRQRDWDDAHLINAAFDAHAEDPRFGYRFIADELADQAFIASETVCGGCARCRGSSRSIRRSVA